MRRDKPIEKNIFNVGNAFLFLWWKCECCKEQLRLERVWSFTLFNKNAYGGGISPGAQLRVMVCKKCCPKIKQAEHFALEFNKDRNEFHEFPDSSGLPMPNCKPTKPQEPLNIVTDSSGDIIELSPLDSCR